MTDYPSLPALSDDELREILDLMATAIASMSNRIDDLITVGVIYVLESVLRARGLHLMN